jgi:pimeloyl-ACP methyl ester carboxylesterase
MHVLLFLMGAAMTSDVYDRVEHGYADSNGVKIHYASLGQGPLVVMLHGFPDFWYSWRDQMDALSSNFQTVAIDLRGYNLSDKPAGIENYAMPLLVGDVAAVIRHLGKDKAIVVGHDWGGAVAWFLALTQPQMVEKLVILNLPLLGLRDAQVFADAVSCGLDNLRMPRHRTRLPVGRIPPDGMSTAFPKKLASMSSEMLDELAPLH